MRRRRPVLSTFVELNNVETVSFSTFHECRLGREAVINTLWTSDVGVLSTCG